MSEHIKSNENSVIFKYKQVLDMPAQQECQLVS